MRCLPICLLTIFFFYSEVTPAQTTQFKKYTNPAYKFSFDIPNYWEIKYSKLQSGFICSPITTKEKEIYKNCFEGIVFRMELYNSEMDSILINEGLYTKIYDVYYTADRFSDSLKATNIEGGNWKGIYHRNTCGMSCKETGFDAAAGQCDFLYFSKGKTTICINTNGRALERAILNRLISSFKFN